MLPYSEWLEEAQGLPLGRSKRVKHCNNNNTMKLSHDDDGFAAYCFRCSEGGVKSHGERRLRDLFAEKEFQYAQTVTLPEDYTLCVPPSAAVWYYGAGIGAELASSYQVGWSASLGRVILPVFDSTAGLVVVQARAVDKRIKPKYLNQGGNRKASVLFRSHSCTGTDDKVCITEDILSCIRVGEIMPAVCPMGTSLSDAQAGQLLQWNTALIWLDNDEAGWKGAAKMNRKLCSVMDTHIIRSTADPKCYDNQAIQQLTSI